MQFRNLYNKKTQMTKLENALIWLYMKTWGKFGDHVIEENDLWNFSGDDLEKVIMGLAFPRKKEKTDRVKALTDLIMDKFEQDGTAFYEWAVKIHGEFIEDLPKAMETKQNGKNLHLNIYRWYFWPRISKTLTVIHPKLTLDFQNIYFSM